MRSNGEEIYLPTSEVMDVKLYCREDAPEGRLKAAEGLC